jgi:tRNA (adenine22-N1)-methyltransferase
VAQSARELILQPQSEIYQVRRFLQEQGYYILQEDMVWEDGKYYPMMKVHYAPDASVAWDEVELHFGPCLLQAHHPVLLQYLQREQQIQLRVLDRLHHSHRTDAITARIQEIETTLALIAEGISRCS